LVLLLNKTYRFPQFADIAGDAKPANDETKPDESEFDANAVNWIVP
jgi:hypothetical protein